MDYPEEFSLQARDHVEAARIKADQALRRVRAERSSDRSANWERVAFNVEILSVLGVFACEAVELRKQGWSIGDISSAADEFLRQLTIDAWFEHGPKGNGLEVPDPGGSNWDGSLRPELRQLFHESEEWHEFETELLKLADQSPAVAFELEAAQAGVAASAQLHEQPYGTAANETAHPSETEQADSITLPRSEPARATKLRHRKALQNNPLFAVKALVRQLKKEGSTHEQICKRLGDQPRPPGAEWHVLTWPVAYRQHRSSVDKWLSKHCPPEKASSLKLEA